MKWTKVTAGVYRNAEGWTLTRYTVENRKRGPRGRRLADRVWWRLETPGGDWADTHRTLRTGKRRFASSVALHEMRTRESAERQAATK